jgi:hypothetical protein
MLNLIILFLISNKYWTNNARRKLPVAEPVVARTYFDLNTGEKEDSKKFQKHATGLLNEEEFRKANLTLIQYFGSLLLSVTFY